ncbi:hypothetical protein [Paenibacillus sp. PAMC21692]|uniref:hypothetical protein n=1 Tax=Paenibacillus sp. PAMC21692 TaxID=2762320 RepID=UPI00164D19F8|nr:hypothetical protein [Paenibacillus sp. PAMC21692]QNK55066.1 hypothetical protein H7F31_20835 [Paenibacillus sp. PAMC21692]
MEYTEIFSEKLISLVKEKLNSIGEVKTVKFVRVETGMSLMAAKKLVDACKE